jgi:hypothetical protein
MAFVYDRTKDKAVDAARRMELGLSVHYHDDTDTTLLTFEGLEHNVKFDFTVRAPETRVRSGTGPDAREVRVAESATLLRSSFRSSCARHSEGGNISTS